MSIVFNIAVLAIVFASVLALFSRKSGVWVKRIAATGLMMAIPYMLQQSDNETAILLFLVGAGLLLCSYDERKQARFRMADAHDEPGFAEA